MEDLPWVWAVVVREQTARKGSGDSEDCFRHDDTLDIADGEEPDGVRVVESLGELARLVSGGRRSGVGARVFGEGGLAILVDCRNEYAGSVAQHVWGECDNGNTQGARMMRCFNSNLRLR